MPRPRRANIGRRTRNANYVALLRKLQTAEERSQVKALQRERNARNRINMSEDEYVTCPYDSHHRVPRSRLQRHIIKCEKIYPKLWICPFNATHRVPDHMKADHYTKCPDAPKEQPIPRAKEAQVVTGGAVTAPTPILQSDYLSKDDPDYECWD